MRVNVPKHCLGAAVRAVKLCGAPAAHPLGKQTYTRKFKPLKACNGWAKQYLPVTRRAQGGPAVALLARSGAPDPGLHRLVVANLLRA